jgi:hypothetical protein
LQSLRHVFDAPRTRSHCSFVVQFGCRCCTTTTVVKSLVKCVPQFRGLLWVVRSPVGSLGEGRRFDSDRRLRDPLPDLPIRRFRHEPSCASQWSRHKWVTSSSPALGDWPAGLLRGIVPASFINLAGILVEDNGGHARVPTLLHVHHSHSGPVLFAEQAAAPSSSELLGANVLVLATPIWTGRTTPRPRRCRPSTTSASASLPTRAPTGSVRQCRRSTTTTTTRRRRILPAPRMAASYALHLAHLLDEHLSPSRHEP